jgi:glycosyltransferase involved in cell wall biosynthesis
MSQTEAVRSTLPTISIVTATYNAAALLPRLVASLKAQTDQDFEWVVADGGSNDDTVKIVEDAKASLRQVVLTSQRDFGIYDALNRAIHSSTSEYYIILGADDLLLPKSIEEIKKEISRFNQPELISFGVVINGKVFYKTKFKLVWLYAARSIISSHSVGVCICKRLHEKFGMYNKKYYVLADSHFLLKAFKGGVAPSYSNYVSGVFCTNGISNTDRLQSYSEQMRILLEVGGNPILQLVLFNLRTIKLILKL